MPAKNTVRPRCPACRATGHLAQYILNKRDVAARWYCSRCGTRWNTRPGYFKGGKNLAAVVMYAVLRYHSHPTLRQIVRELAALGCHVTAAGVNEWIQRYDRHWRKLDPRLRRWPLHPKHARRLRREIRSLYRGRPRTR